MNDEDLYICEILDNDDRYPSTAYYFIRDALAFAADTMELNECSLDDSSSETESELFGWTKERHLTGQQFCEALRLYALNQYGYMAKVVLKSWGVDSTRCFGDLVYNMISVGMFKKSSDDEQTHFDDVYDFDDVFQVEFEIGGAVSPRRL
jgi:uncharacterized repeat protein (TIGR04138 family)